MKGFHLPTAFSPNGDLKNDYFRFIVGYNVKSFNLRIFDRWGKSMVNTGDPKFVWDGTFKGKDVEGGVYVYSVEVNYFDGSTESLSGNITVIR